MLRELEIRQKEIKLIKVITKRDFYDERKASKQIFAKICLLRFQNSFLKGNKGVRMDQRFHP
jgi:hypothetical protein